MSTKEEVLLELVLVNFSNIKELLNTTKDIEDFLTKLKLHKRIDGIGGIVEKVKNVVDNLYDSSVKVRDEFYKHFNNLEIETVSQEKENSDDNSENAMFDENFFVIDTIGDQEQSKSKEDLLPNAENIKSGISEMESNNKANASNSSAVIGNEKNEDVGHTSKSTTGNATETIIVENRDEPIVENRDEPIVENRDEPIPIPTVDMDKNESSEDEHVDSQKVNEVVNDSVVEKSNKSDIDNTTEDPLESDRNSPDETDSNILENTDDIEKNVENTEESDDISEKVLESSVTKKEPRIRLVDLSKLIDPKPKKSVKFDSSIIILTSSDEENSAPKKKSEIKDQNGILKPALKPSPQKNICVNVETVVKENEKLLSNKKCIKNQHESDTEESESKSSSSKRDKRNKHTKSEKKKSSSELNKSNSDKDSKKDNEANKDKHMKKDNTSSTDSEVSDEEPSKKKKKVPKEEKINKSNSDSSDCVIQDDSDCDMLPASDKSTRLQKSRRSTRLSKNVCRKAKEKEKLRTLFKRKPSKHGTSQFEIVSKKPTSSESESDCDSGSKHLIEKKDGAEDRLSDTSSLSHDENSQTEEATDKPKNKYRKDKKRKRKTDILNSMEDEKFSYEVYIPLPRIECERIKEIYLRNLELLEIKRLTNTLKSGKRHRKNKSDSKSSSDTEKPKIKKSKSVTLEKESVNEETSDDEPLTDIVKKLVMEKHKDDDAVVPRKPIEDDERMSDIIMDNMQCSSDKGKRSENSDNDSEDGKHEKTDESTHENVEQQSSENGGDKTEEKMQTSDTEAKIDEENNKECEEKGTTKSNSSDDNREEQDNSENVNENDKEGDKNEDGSKSKDGREEEKVESTNAEDKESDKKDEDGNNEDKTSGTEDKNTDTEDKNSGVEDKDNEQVQEKEKENDEDGTNIESEKDKEKKESHSEKLLTLKINSTDSDSEEEFSKYNEKKEKSRAELISDDEITSVISKSKAKKKNKKKFICDSDESDGEAAKNDSSSDESKKSSEKSSSSGEEEQVKKPTRRRIKRTKHSSSSSDDDKSTRKQIRKVIGKDALSETTKQAEAEEKERKSRIAEKQKKYNQIYEELTDSKVEKLVLDYDEKKKKELLSVHKGIVKKLKPHQASGIQFMWDACFESLHRTTTTKGSGCILAHCMGLGKTLQVIALTHTLLTNDQTTGVQKILVVCPVNTVLNWKAEFKKWMPRGSEIEVHELVSCKQNYERQYVVQEWHQDGGVLIIGYAMFRNLSNPDNKRISRKMRTVFQEGLVDPGPDLVVCDEGHLLKNEKTNLSIAMNRIKTLRRIVLTGTPLQNNLKEYWCMVQFIKPNLLGTYKEYLNRFVNPITNGQYTDSTQHDIVVMRKRSHVLHKLLDGVVQRRDYSVLEPYLPPKYEYVLFVSLTEAQTKLYTHYMERFARQNDGSNRTSFLFTDFQQLQRICTHPRVLLDRTRERKEKEYDTESEGSLRDFIDDGEVSDGTSTSSSNSSSDSEGSNNDGKKTKSKRPQKTRVTRAQAALRKENNEESDSEVEEVTPKEWWQEYCDGAELDNINNSGKLFLLFQILKECEEIGDKVLVFSQSLYTLNCIEYFLQSIDEATQDGQSERVGGYSGSWSIGLDYFRLDGSSSCDNRATWCNNFNNPDNPRARLFLISTKAGGLGINLVAANRVIIFDVSWNPSHDVQSIYRVYRFGQTKPCYIYRFVSYGTMEMKIYERQVTKQAISKRVIDEQQIDRHYNQNDLQELYKCDLNPTDRPTPLVPKDVLLGELLQKYEKSIYKYHLHQSLLENKEEEGLNEEERKAAWEEFENEKVLRKNTSSGLFNNFNMNAQAIAAALANIVRKDNPTWSEVQINGIIPALVQQLQVQLTEGDMTMYQRVQKEMQLMQALQAQKMRELYYQQQVMRMIQQQQQQAKLLGNMNVDVVPLNIAQANLLNNRLANVGGGPSSAQPRHVSNDVIELND